MKSADLLQRIYKSSFETAARIVSEGRQIEPMMVAVSRTSAVVSMALHPLPKEKWAMAQDYLLHKTHDIVAIGIITEGWAVRAKNDKALRAMTVPPSAHPERTEVVLFVFTLKDGSRMSSICNIERPRNVLRFEALTLNTTTNFVTGAVMPHSAVEDSHDIDTTQPWKE